VRTGIPSLRLKIKKKSVRGQQVSWRGCGVGNREVARRGGHIAANKKQKSA
jgi:hypothetical protein